MSPPPADMPGYRSSSSSGGNNINFLPKSFFLFSTMSYLLLHVQQLLAGGDRSEPDKRHQCLAPLGHQEASLLPGPVLLDEPLQQREVSLQQHPLQLPAGLTAVHTLTHTQGAQHHHTGVWDGRRRVVAGGRSSSSCSNKKKIKLTFFL